MPRKRTTKEINIDTINREKLIEVLTKVKPGLASREIIEQSSHFIFEEDRIWTYNDQIAISQGFKSHLVGAVKADEFYKLLNKLEDDELLIDTQKGEFCVQGKTVTANIKIDSDIKLQPIQAPGINSKDWQALPEDFNNSISLCLFSASRNMIRPELTCLYVTGKTIFSTDTFRATKKEMKSKVKTDFLLPANAAKELVKYNVYKIFTETEGWLHFTNKEHTMFSCRVYADIKYPQKIWDFFDINGKEIKLPDSFEKIINRVSTLVDSDFDLDRFITLTIKANKLICYGQGSCGSISEKVDIDYGRKEISVKVHPTFLEEIVKQLNSVIIGERLLFKGKDFEHAICLSN